MKNLLIAVSALAFSAPVFATALTDTPASTPSAVAETATAASATTPVAASSDPKAIIASEFPTYDKDSNGSLSRAEFDSWMMTLKEKSGDSGMKPADQASWLKTAFATADKDQSKGVTLAELTDYLTAAG